MPKECRVLETLRLLRGDIFQSKESEILSLLEEQPFPVVLKKAEVV